MIQPQSSWKKLGILLGTNGIEGTIQTRWKPVLGRGWGQTGRNERNPAGQQIISDVEKGCVILN